MKEKMQYFGYTLAGIVKPWEREPNIFAQGFLEQHIFCMCLLLLKVDMNGIQILIILKCIVSIL